MRKQEEKSGAKVVVGKQAAVSHISQTVGTVIFVFIHLPVSHTIRECSCFLFPSILVTKWSCLILVFFKIVDVQQKNTSLAMSAQPALYASICFSLYQPLKMIYQYHL